MCGIAGFVDPAKGMEVLEAMASAIARRGPDDVGYHLRNGVGFGHRRLAIIDLSPLGHQPMRFENLVMAFNGEIYNYREIAQELVGRGYSFTSASDSEVILKAFHCWGPRCVNRFVGMFALAVHDEADNALYLIRDRAGVKPLYYYHEDGRLAFGSTLAALRPYLTPSERAAIDPAALSEFLAFGYIGSGLSIISSIRKLPQGHFLKFHNGRAFVERYWGVRFEENPAWAGRTADDLVDELDEIVTSAFKYRMVADVPVGVFLSAGVDSSLVTSVLSKHFGTLRTFTIGFSEAGWDESSDARKIADHLGSVHTEAVLTADRGLQILEDFYDIYDEPHGDASGIATTFVAQLAKEEGVKVVLSADGGDELFGGYTRYLEFDRRWSQVQRLSRLGRGGARGLFRLLSSISSPARSEQFSRYADIMDEQPFIPFMQKRIRCASSRDFRSIYPSFEDRITGAGEGRLLEQMCQWDFDRYMVDDVLVKVDRATMYHSIEGREPFLDHRLIEFAVQLPSQFKIRNGETKFLLKKLLGRYLPKQLFNLPKRGFGAPLNLWIRDLYHSRFLEVLRDSSGFFERKELQRLLGRYESGEVINYTLLWNLFSFQSWYNHWMADAPAPRRAEAPVKQFARAANG